MTAHDVMSRYFKEWSFTASGDSVQVHSRENVAFAKEKLREHGMENVRVTYISDGRQHGSMKHTGRFA